MTPGKETPKHEKPQKKRNIYINAFYLADQVYRRGEIGKKRTSRQASRKAHYHSRLQGIRWGLVFPNDPGLGYGLAGVAGGGEISWGCRLRRCRLIAILEFFKNEHAFVFYRIADLIRP